jgi:hypothetical protein
MHAPPLDRAGRSHQPLAQHLATEHLRRADVPALAAEEVLLEALEVEQRDQVLQRLPRKAAVVQPTPPLPLLNIT